MLSPVGDFFDLAIDQIAQSGLSSLKVIYYSAQLFSNYYLDKSKTTGLRYWMNHCEICGERLGDYELFCVENDAFRLMTIEKLLRAKIRKVNKLFVSTAGNPAEHKITDIVRYLCDARFVMNGPA
ncbi:hypothetical protein C6Q34_07865 [Citrobacter freundii]|nr:hypothetical protein C6Q34_07865 [Citrobacter freundii]